MRNLVSADRSTLTNEMSAAIAITATKSYSISVTEVPSMDPIQVVTHTTTTTTAPTAYVAAGSSSPPTSADSTLVALAGGLVATLCLVGAVLVAWRRCRRRRQKGHNDAVNGKDVAIDIRTRHDNDNIDDSVGIEI